MWRGRGADLDPGEAYQFSTLLVVKSIETGELWAAFDSGCSCPTPFEDTKFPSDFVHIREMRDIESQINEHFEIGGDYQNISANEVADFKGKIREALREQAAARRGNRPRIEFSCSEDYKPLGGLYGDLPGLAAQYPHLSERGPHEGLNAVDDAVEIIFGSPDPVKVRETLLKLSMDSWTLGYEKGLKNA